METKKILIVDDEPVLLEQFSNVLRSENYSVVTATNGVECLNIVQEENPELILLDLKMPVMDGFETIKRLRLIKKIKYTPIVFLTGYGKTPDAIDSGYLLGGNEYWLKPISSEELIVRVRAILRIADVEKKYRKLQQAFYSMIVHDLRNPIGTILGESDDLLEEKGSLGKDHVAMVSMINTAAVQLLQIAKNMLQLSNFESGEYIIQRIPILLSDMVNTILEEMNTVRKQKNIDVKVDIEKSLVLSVDEEYFKEVLDNLFDNALRFTPVNGKIYFGAKHHPAKDSNGKESIIIELGDTGCGISDKEISTLFDKSRINSVGFRRPNTRTGFRLVICREIVEAHDGTIAVESKVGEGSKFMITLPA